MHAHVEEIAKSRPIRHKIDSLQILRAFAALVVVHFHTDYEIGSWHTVGSFGVDIFFVISGFIMAMISASEAKFFFLKRLIRIVPLYWTITVVIFIGLVTHPHIDPLLKRGWVEFWKSLLFIPYLRPDGSPFPILVVGWTLNYEVCFYIVIGLALLVSRKHAMALASAGLLGLIVLMRLLPKTGVSSFFGDSIMIEFLGGIAAYYVFLRFPVELSRRLRPAFFLVIPLAVGAMMWVQGTGFDRLPRVLRLGVPALLLMQSVVLLSKSGLDVRWRIPVLLGDASYSLYLSHLFVISAFKRVVSSHVAILAPTRVGGMLMVLGVSSVAAIGIHLMVDSPVYRYLNGLLAGWSRGPADPWRMTPGDDGGSDGRSRKRPGELADA